MYYTFIFLCLFTEIEKKCDCYKKSWSYYAIDISYSRNTKIHKIQPQKMIQHTQTNSSATAGEMFECVWQFCGIDA